MSASIAATLYNVGYANSIAQSMSQNQASVLVLTPQEYFGILRDRAKNNPVVAASLRSILNSSRFGQYWQEEISPNTSKPWVGPVALGANDGYLIAKTFSAVGMAGIKSWVKATPKGTYIVLTGYSDLRKVSAGLTGTTFLASNPKMIQLGLGIKGAANAAKGGFILGVVVSTGIEVVDFIFNDEKTMHDLVGGIGVEAVKAGLATMVGYGLASVVGTATTVAILPLGVLVVAVLLVGIGLNTLDSSFQFKQRVIDLLKATPEQTSPGIYVVNTKSETWLAQTKADMQAKQAEIGETVHRSLVDWLCPICRRY